MIAWDGTRLGPLEGESWVAQKIHEKWSCRQLVFHIAEKYIALEGLSQTYVLHPPAEECVEALVSLPGSDPVAVMGGTDAQKLRSSMTLFVHAAGESERATFKAALDKYSKGAEDEATLSRI